MKNMESDILDKLVRAYTKDGRIYGITENCDVYLLNHKEVYKIRKNSFVV